ncbi:MAG: carboxyltransferase domain-containing protein [Acidimicrobiales bacterium]|jgi:KipI family sensor histidine kinase inhibitor
MPTRSVPVGEIRRLGDHALLIGVPDAVAARRLTRSLAAARLEGVAEVVGGLATVMVAFDPRAGDVDDRRSVLAHLMEEISGQPDAEDGGAILLDIPCTFDGPDLAEVASLVGSTPEAVVAMMTAGPLTVAVVGFSPGFAYLAGLPAALRRVPRRSRPRPSVPAGSVALAGGHAAVYPSASPGGWQLVGHTDEQLFTPWVPPYARLAPGDRVRFVRPTAAVGNGAGKSTSADGPVPSLDTPPPGARPVFEVDEPGLRSVLQDGGRKGLAALGVPAASPADPDSFRLANELVGNPIGACTLEITARGPTLRCLSPTFVAVVGGSPDLRLQGQPVAAGRVVPVTAGQQLVVGSVRGGFRCYLAMAGGFVGPAVLGSFSSDQLAGLGPGPIMRGARLWGAATEPPLGDHLRPGASRALERGEPVALRVVPGPHHERFVPGTFAALASMRFTVEGASNRVGLRLRRDPRTPALVAAPGSPGELDSQGMVTGAVQVPPDGQPVILMTDHATLGGYPVVAVVAAVDHGVLGQCAPGTTVVLVPCDCDEAGEALREHRRALSVAVVGHYPLAVE